ncbi:MAG: nuclear transport factor 2 family protein [Chitinophagaceae bacterium]|nr:nuclear transport factor 2 family protein [Chitinophagaceae bacterium]
MIKKLITAAVLFMLLGGTAIQAQSKTETAVAAAVEKLRLAMTSGDSIQLSQLVTDDLSYGHSSGHIDDKKTFVSKLVSGKSDFVSITLSEQQITLHGKTAIVRHKLDAVTNDNNKPGEVHLYVLLVWVKEGGVWKLCARQAVKHGV